MLGRMVDVVILDIYISVAVVLFSLVWSSWVVLSAVSWPVRLIVQRGKVRFALFVGEQGSGVLG